MLSTIHDTTIRRLQGSDALVTQDQYHPLIEFFLAHIKRSIPLMPSLINRFNRVDFAVLNNNIGSLNWNDIFQTKCVDTALYLFYSKIFTIFEDLVSKINKITWINKYYIN